MNAETKAKRVAAAEKAVTAADEKLTKTLATYNVARLDQDRAKKHLAWIQAAPVDDAPVAYNPTIAAEVDGA